MKKLLLSALLLTGVATSAKANTVTIDNQTMCTYIVHLSGLGDITVSPGVTSYTSLPGQDIFGARVYYQTAFGGGAYDGAFAVNYYYNFFNTLTGSAPLCIPASASAFYGSWWQPGSTSANAQLTLFFM